MLHAGRPVDATLRDTIARVSEHRQVGAVSHAVNRIGRERWLRAQALADPGTVGVSNVALVEPVPPRTSLLEARAAALLGVDDAGALTLVVFSAGVDLGGVPEAVDLIATTNAERVIFAAPERDHLPAVAELIRLLPVPAELVAVAEPWVA